MTTTEPAPLDIADGAERFRVRRGFTGLFWSEPSRTLSPRARAALRRDFVPVALDTFTGTTPAFWDDWLSDDNLDDLDGLVLVLDDDGRPAAWVASNRRHFGDHRCFYANSAGVHPRYQGSGLSSTIWRKLLQSAVTQSFPRRMYAVMRTANPLVYSAWAAGAGGMDKAYPSPARADIPPAITRIAAGAAEHLGQLDRFDPNTLVIRNAYEHTENGLWTQRPTSDQIAVDEWMKTELGPKDAIVLVVAFDPVPILIKESIRKAASLIPHR